MKKIIKRLITAVLTFFILAAILTGCSNNYGDTHFVYVPEFVDFPGEPFNVNIRDVVYANDLLYYSSTALISDEAVTRFFAMNLDGTNQIPIMLTNQSQSSGIPEGATRSVEIQSLCADTYGDVWIADVEYLYRFDFPEDFEDAGTERYRYFKDLGSVFNIRKLNDPDRGIISADVKSLSVDIHSITGNDKYFNINAFNMDDEGNIYISAFAGDTNSIFVLGKDGGLQLKLDVDGYVQRLIRMIDGSVAYSGYTDGSFALRRIDLSGRARGDIVALPGYVNEVFQGDGEFDILYTDRVRLYGLTADSGESIKLLDWINSDVDPERLSNIMILPDSRILCINEVFDWSTGLISGTKLIILTKTPISDTQQKIILTLAACYPDPAVREAVEEFNSTSDTHRIQIIDYFEPGTPDGMGWFTGIDKLALEIIAGKIPDIMVVHGLPYRQYVKKGLLEDLYPYIDADPEYSRDDFLNHILKAEEIDGGLYQISPTFSIGTMIGSPAVLGEGVGWNLDELRTVLENNPNVDFPIGQFSSKESLIRYLISIDDFIDWTTGTAYFDSDTFVELLEFVNHFYAGYIDDMWREPELIASGRQIMVNFNLTSFERFQIYRSMFGGELVFKGFPNESRNGNSIGFSTGAAITTACTDKDVAWDFLRTFLSRDFQLGIDYGASQPSGFPTNAEAFDLRAKSAMVIGERSVRISADTWIAFTELTQKELDQILTLIETATPGTNEWHGDLLNIITEGADDYFNGRSTAQEAARIIQSRASRYIAEQS